MNIEPADVPIQFYRGTDLVVEIQFLDSENNPVDITGYSFISHVRKTANGVLIMDLSPILTSKFMMKDVLL